MYRFKFIWITVVKLYVIYGPMIHEAFKFFVNNSWKKLSMELHSLFLISGYVWKIVQILFNIAPLIHNGNSEILSLWNVKGSKKMFPTVTVCLLLNNLVHGPLVCLCLWNVHVIFDCYIRALYEFLEYYCLHVFCFSEWGCLRIKRFMNEIHILGLNL